MENKTLRDLVLRDFRLAEVFDKNRLNYCCSVSLPLEEACLNANLDTTQIASDISAVTWELKIPGNLGYKSWSLDFLVNYIENVYHAYFLKTGPVLINYLNAYEEAHPKLPAAELEVISIAGNLVLLILKQIANKEKTVFPYIRQLQAALSQRKTYGTLFVKTMRKPFTEMEESGVQIRESMSDLAKATCRFTVRDKSCVRYKVLIQKLQQVYCILHEQQQIEDRFLFPRAVEAEQNLLEV